MMLEPSYSLRLHGFVKVWGKMKGHGLIESSGVIFNDVFLHRNDLPPEVRDQRLDFLGADVSFALDWPQGGKARATQVHLLVEADSTGRWQLSRRLQSQTSD